MKSFKLDDLPKSQIALLGGIVIITAIKLLTHHDEAVTTITQLFAIAAAIGVGFGLGWLTTPSGKLVRTWALVIALLLLAYGCLGKSNPLGWSFTSLAATIGFFVALFFWLGNAVKSTRRKSTTFGSAEWAGLPYLEEHNVVGTEGLRLGSFTTPDKTAPLHYDGDRHLMTVAPTRSGKGTTAIIPNLLTYTGSVIVIDPKGENAMVTCAQRERMGQKIFIVDPWGIASDGQSAKFNPIDWLDINDIDLTENSMLLSDALVVPSGKGESFWDEEAKAYLQGLLLYVATDPHEEGRRTLPRVRDLLMMDGDNRKLLYQRMLDSPHHLVVSTGARSSQKDEKLLASVLATAQSHTHFLDSARLRESMSASDFKFEDLKTKPMTIYLVLPADRLDTFSRWLRLLIQQAIVVNARNLTAKPAKPILFILDEMTSLGKLKMVEQAYSLMAGYGMQLWGIVQDLGRLKEIYGDGGYESMIGNSGCTQYYGSTDNLTSEYFSKMCGVATVDNLSTAIARSFSSGPQGGSSSSSTTDTVSAMQRKLAYPDELRRLPGDSQVIFIENHHPIIGTKVRWFNDPALRDLGRNLHKK